MQNFLRTVRGATAGTLPLAPVQLLLEKRSYLTNLLRMLYKWYWQSLTKQIELVFPLHAEQKLLDEYSPFSCYLGGSLYSWTLSCVLNPFFMFNSSIKKKRILTWNLAVKSVYALLISVCVCLIACPLWLFCCFLL